MLIKLIYSIIGLILVLFLLLFYMSNPFGSLSSNIKHYGESSTEIKKDTIRIMTLNMAYGYGIGSDGVGYMPKPKELIYERLNSIAMMLEDFNVDIVLLQEVDFDADRSGNRDQAQYLAEKSALKYAASVTSWNANYVPFPYLPVSHQFGKVQSGGAILSRFPIEKQTVTILDKPKSNAWWYNWFYLARYIQQVSISINGVSYDFFNAHLEAYDKDNRANQAEKLVQSIQSSNKALLFGGDFNSIPDFGTQFHNFADEYGDDYRNDKTQSILRKQTEFVEPRDLSKNESTYFTFPALNPNRQLDYLFVSQKVKVIGYERLETGDLSDHLPILLTIEL